MPTIKGPKIVIDDKMSVFGRIMTFNKGHNGFFHICLDVPSYVQKHGNNHDAIIEIATNKNPLLDFDVFEVDKSDYQHIRQTALAKSGKIIHARISDAISRFSSMKHPGIAECKPFMIICFDDRSDPYVAIYGYAKHRKNSGDYQIFEPATETVWWLDASETEDDYMTTDQNLKFKMQHGASPKPDGSGIGAQGNRARSHAITHNPVPTAPKRSFASRIFGGLFK